MHKKGQLPLRTGWGFLSRTPKSLPMGMGLPGGLWGCVLQRCRFNLIRNRGLLCRWGSGLCFLMSPFAGARQPLRMGTEGALWLGHP